MSADETSDAESGLTYDFEYSWHSTYGRAARLIASQVPAGMVVDLGAGVGTLGEAVAPYGFGYVAVDGDEANVAAMRARGRVAEWADLLDDGVTDRIVELVGDDDLPVVAISMLDVIEHLPDPDRTLSMLRELVDRFTARQGTRPLVVLSVPNVAHYDLGAKLALGRWDVTQTGLLDTTHVTLFTEERLDSVMSAHGFTETCRDDVIYDITEQRGPGDLPVFGATVLAEFLLDLRTRTGGSPHLYQFVRSYTSPIRTSPVRDGVPTAGPMRDSGQPHPFVSVVVRTTGARSTLLDALSALAAQHDRDLEVLLMVHTDDHDVVARIEREVAMFESAFAEQIRPHHVVGGGRSRPLNEALGVARGRYFAILDDDDIVTPDWIATFRRLADKSPGRMVRAGCVVQWMGQRDIGTLGFEVESGFESAYPRHFDVLDSIRTNRSPACSYAVPTDAVRALGITFDEQLRVCEDWKFELEVALVCGVVDDPAVTSVYRRWRAAGGSSHTEDTATWVAHQEAVIDSLDVAPTMFPAGTLRTIQSLYRHIEQLESELGRRRPDDPPFATTQ